MPKEDLPINNSELNTIIMAVIHDVKDSLNHSLNTLEHLKLDIPEQATRFNELEQEIKSVNTSLIRILALYKMRTSRFSLQRDQHNLYDFLYELSLLNTTYGSENTIKFNVICDYDIDWFFDHELITNVINSIIHNNLRYTREAITLEARIVDHYLHIMIKDDGAGYPEKMISEKKNFSTGINFNLSNSGLGLYFAEKIAQMHTNDDKSGYTDISNLDEGGGCFSIYLP